MYEQNVGELTNTRCKYIYIYIDRSRNHDGIDIVKIRLTRKIVDSCSLLLWKVK